MLVVAYFFGGNAHDLYQKLKTVIQKYFLLNIQLGCFDEG
jgi:hypothetical protein